MPPVCAVDWRRWRIRGRQALVKGQPAKGAATTDTYSLIGFTKALNEIDKACGIKR